MCVVKAFNEPARARFLCEIWFVYLENISHKNKHKTLQKESTPSADKLFNTWSWTYLPFFPRFLVYCFAGTQNYQLGSVNTLGVLRTTHTCLYYAFSDRYFFQWLIKIVE